MKIRALRPVIFWLIALLAFPSIVAACGGDTSSSEDSIFVELLGVIPDTPNTRESVMINDYAAVREILGVQLPGPDADETALQEYFVSVGWLAHLAAGPFITGLNSEAMENPRRQYLAFDARNVDQSVEAGRVPAFLEVARGRFDPDATAQALASCSECPPPDIETHNEVSFYSWGRDYAGILRERNGPPAFDHLGRGGRIAVSSEYVYRTVETPGMEAMIDSRSGDRQSLADVEEFRLLGRAMSGLGAYAAFFTDQTQRISQAGGEISTFSHLAGVNDKLKDEIGKSTLLLPYQAFAAGTGRDDTGPYMALALVHADASSAEENVQRLRLRFADSQSYPELQDWRDLLEDSLILQEGRILSVTARGDGPASIWMSMVYGLIPLIPHE